MATEWAHLKRVDWASKPDVAAGTALLTGWFDVKVPIQVVIGRSLGGGDKEVIRPLAERGYRFTSDRSSVALVLHPAPKAQEQIVETLEDGGLERVLTVLWTKEPLFEGWLASRASKDIAAPNLGGDLVDPVVCRAMIELELMRNPGNGISYGYGKDYAISALRLLREAGYSLGNPGLEGAAFRAGLSWSEVVCLRDFADGVKVGKRFQVGSERFGSNSVAEWAGEAVGSNGTELTGLTLHE
jgi:hypothetical protein